MSDCPFSIRYDSNGRMCNPDLPAGVDGVPGASFRNFKPTRRQLRRSSRYVTKFPCPFTRQYAVCETSQLASRLDLIFVRQRAVLRKATGVPYVRDELAEAEAEYLAHINRHVVGTSLAGFC